MLPPHLQGHSHAWQIGLLFTSVGVLVVPFSAFYYFLLT